MKLAESPPLRCEKCAVMRQESQCNPEIGKCIAVMRFDELLEMELFTMMMECSRVRGKTRQSDSLGRLNQFIRNLILYEFDQYKCV